jgi:hypothetical protein
VPKMIATTFRIRREATGQVFLDFTTDRKRNFTFEISESAFPVLRKHLIKALNLPRPVDVDPTKSGPPDMEAPNLLQKIGATAEPGAEWISLKFEMANGRSFDVPLALSDAEAVIETIRQALGIASNGRSQSEPSDRAAQILSFQCECDPDTQQIFLQFEAQNRTPIALTLTVPRAQQVIESIGRALAVVKANPPTTRQ